MMEKRYNTFRVLPKNVDKILKSLKRKGINVELGEKKVVRYYSCCPSCDVSPVFERVMQEIRVPAYISGNKFNKILVEAGIEPSHMYRLNVY